MTCIVIYMWLIFNLNLFSICLKNIYFMKKCFVWKCEMNFIFELASCSLGFRFLFIIENMAGRFIIIYLFKTTIYKELGRT